MAEKEDVVYLEDLDSPSEAKPEAPAAIAPIGSDIEKVAESSSALEPPPASSSTKRQRTLVDMFTAAPAAKKAKPGASTSGAASQSGGTGSAPVVKVNGLQALNSIPFSMSSYLESLTDEQRKLLHIECETMGKTWLKLLKDEIKKPYFIALKKFLWEEGVTAIETKSLKVYPPPKDIYAWSRTPIGQLKVVIIGQDPYHGRGQAHGLCFSVPHGISVPPSLRNIYAEIKAEYPEFQPPKHGNLTSWADNGVLLLNTCLTVKAGNAGSHSNKGWEEFTDKVVDAVDKYGGANLPSSGSLSKPGYGRGVVFLAWGAWAAKRVAKLDKKKHLILTSAHPSPYSANKGFLGNGHFKKANDWLGQKYGAQGRVDWCKLDVV
ncbi:hypothetical protein JAAARDRAFT_194397 [Jaapia argillacea MUCL 33604]|uniref:Uracil-DNA glycosylase n=1 Tax=Jaapia argillacea MUCL 33604 TaxID=933084 RepID=A0A067PTR8_9AGAM|nr:hypothetical protein JAAARDRAFT_194397 [Jaapia argillacea MUCL 33604]